jgi:hypothetical protein
MRPRCLVIALTFLAVIASDSLAKSQPKNSQQTKTAQQSAPDDQRGTEKSPAFIKIIPTPKTPEETESDRKERADKDRNDRSLVWLTGALAFIGFLQLLVFGWQGIQLKRTVSAAKDATDLGNREFIATHRPRVIVRYIQGPDFDAEGQQFITVTFVNIGINPATIEAFGGDLVRRNKQSGHFALGGLQASPIAITPITLVSGQRHFFTVRARKPYGDAEIAEDAFDGIELCAAGGIKYRDGNGILRETAVFRIHTSIPDSFVISVNDTELNYQD